MGCNDCFLVIVGLCFIYDFVIVIEYVYRFKVFFDKFLEDFVIVMCVYFEKLCIIVGWKGLINDFDIDEIFKINKGFCVFRQFFCDFIFIGMFIVIEMLDIIFFQFLVDLILVGVIGVCIIEFQFYCEFVFGLFFFIGFKNGIDGSFGVVIDVIGVVVVKYYFMGVIKQGFVVIICISGNEYGFVIFRGGIKGINYDKVSVQVVKEIFVKKG